VVLQIFAPSGREVAYIDRKAPGTTPSNKEAEKPLWIARDTKALPIKNASIKLFLDGSGAPIALDELTADKGAQIPPHKHDGSDELLYVLEGKTTTTVGGKSFPVVGGDALRIPANTEHSVTVDEKLVAVQIYAPGGPEQRFKK
jgi:quercetin dioxygenase-like cupin family protein